MCKSMKKIRLKYGNKQVINRKMFMLLYSLMCYNFPYSSSRLHKIGIELT